MNAKYNTESNKLIMPEYGRHVQKMVEHLKTVPDKEDRTRLAKHIVSVMSLLNHGMRDTLENKIKVWDHLAIIGNFELDIDFPVEVTNKEILSEKPNPIPYPNKVVKRRHYGKSVESLLKKIPELENEEQKQQYTQMLANHMKKLYLLWNKEAVNDDLIIKDIQEISGKSNIINNDIKLSETREILHRTKKFRKNNRKGKI